MSHFVVVITLNMVQVLGLLVGIVVVSQIGFPVVVLSLIIVVTSIVLIPYLVVSIVVPWFGVILSISKNALLAAAGISLNFAGFRWISLDSRITGL